MDYAYPPEFPATARAKVAAKKIVAAREFAEKRQGLRRDSEVEAALRVYILQVFLSFAEGAFELGRQGVWSIDQVEAHAREFLRRTAIEANAEMGFNRAGHKLRSMVGNWDGHILPEIQQKLEKTPEWKQYTDGLLELAELQAGGVVPLSQSAGEPTAPASPAEGISEARGAIAQLNTARIAEWMDEEGYTNEVLAQKLNTSPRTVASIRSNGKYHGRASVQKLASLMRCDVADLYLP